MARKTSGADSSRHRRKLLPVPGSNPGALLVMHWHVAGDTHWIQSRVQEVSSWLRTLKLPRVAYAVCGGHLTIWRVDGAKRTNKLMQGARHLMREIFTERAKRQKPI